MTVRSRILALLMMGAISTPLWAEPRAQRTWFGELSANLAGGPIQLGAARPTAMSGSRHAAEITAQQYLHPTEKGEHFATAAVFVRASDLEAGKLMSSRPCWLLQYADALVVRNGDVVRRETLYAIVDAETGVLWELFTRPRKKWWRKEGGAASTQLHHSTVRGRVWRRDIRPAVGLPAVAKTLESPVFQEYLRDESQIVVRPYVETTFSEWRDVMHNGRATKQLTRVDHPIWYVSFKGLNSRFRGSIPPRPGEDMQKFNDMVNSIRTSEAHVSICGKTGTQLGWADS